MPGAHMTYERRSMYSYRISGLHVSSQFELPGAIPEASRTELADVTIRRAYSSRHSGRCQSSRSGGCRYRSNLADGGRKIPLTAFHVWRAS